MKIKMTRAYVRSLLAIFEPEGGKPFTDYSGQPEPLFDKMKAALEGSSEKLVPLDLTIEETRKLSFVLLATGEKFLKESQEIALAALGDVIVGMVQTEKQKQSN